MAIRTKRLAKRLDREVRAPAEWLTADRVKDPAMG
jgi:hypothetical protein